MAIFVLLYTSQLSVSINHYIILLFFFIINALQRRIRLDKNALTHTMKTKTKEKITRENFFLLCDSSSILLKALHENLQLTA